MRKSGINCEFGRIFERDIYGRQLYIHLAGWNDQNVRISLLSNLEYKT